MNSELWIIFLALAVALLMAIKPEMFILNPAHRTPGFTRSLKYIGMSVSLVFLIWLAITFLHG